MSCAGLQSVRSGRPSINADSIRFEDISLRMVGTMLCYTPPRALWRASAGWDTEYDGRAREGARAQAKSWCETAVSMQQTAGYKPVLLIAATSST